MRTKMRYTRLLALLLLLTVSAMAIHAQEDLRINTIFEKYGKQKGATMVIFSGEALSNYRLNMYRSITVKFDKTILDDIQQSLEADKHQARQIKEVINDGIITSGYYQLPEVKTRINRYILFKIGNDGTLTLIYMEGGTDSEELINKMFTGRK
ncbi:MAG: hypothetical protein JJE08_08355 [Proteiniphilum sp.]|nr:hypothetical protein [Proteiniphilum sp.]